MKVGDKVTFDVMVTQGFILYERYVNYDIWGDEQCWIYVTNGIITNVIPMRLEFRG